METVKCKDQARVEVEVAMNLTVSNNILTRQTQWQQLLSTCHIMKTLFHISEFEKEVIEGKEAAYAKSGGQEYWK